MKGGMSISASPPGMGQSLIWGPRPSPRTLPSRPHTAQVCLRPPRGRVRSVPHTVAEQPTQSCRSLASSGLGAVSLLTLICLDVQSYSMPLPFLPAHLQVLGRSTTEAALLAPLYSYSALFAGLCLLVIQGRLKRSRRRLGHAGRWWLLTGIAFAMAVLSAVQAFIPSFAVLAAARGLQGALSLLAWSVALALSMRLPAFLGMRCAAWVFLGDSLGALMGPAFGSHLFQTGGIRLPYLALAATALVQMGLLALCAVKAGKEPDTEAAAAEESGVGVQAIRAPSVLQLCGVLALACGAIRGTLDVAVPLHLAESFRCHPGQIGQAFSLGAVSFTLGSVIGGRYLPRFSQEEVQRWLLVAHSIVCLVAFSVMHVPGPQWVTLMLCIYLFGSATLSVGVTGLLEHIGRKLPGGTDAVSTLSMLGWNFGFSLGGFCIQLATTFSSGATGRQLALISIGVANVLWLLWSRSTRAVQAETTQSLKQSLNFQH